MIGGEITSPSTCWKKINKPQDLKKSSKHEKKIEIENKKQNESKRNKIDTIEFVR